jgi:hypothetical protein
MYALNARGQIALIDLPAPTRLAHHPVRFKAGRKPGHLRVGSGGVSWSEPEASGAYCRRCAVAGGTVAASRDVVGLVEEHVSAVNAQEVGRALEGLAENVVWQTGWDTFVGLDQVEHLLRGAAELFPVLEIKSMLIDGERAAVEMIERYLHDAHPHEVAIAVFVSFEDRSISRVKVFREGSADP